MSLPSFKSSYRSLLQSFLAQDEAKDEKSISWLDDTSLRKSRHFDDFMGRLGKAGADSIINDITS